jgi:predicted PP-loop superfamily ATPase
MRRDMETLFEQIKASPDKHERDYDVIVALSGGKDSTYTLKMLARDYGLRCLAVTIENGFLSDTAVENCYRVTERLETDLILFKPSTTFMRSMYRESIKGGLHPPGAIRRASDVCNSCINLINTRMIKIALAHQVSLIAGGYLGGQVPKNSAIMQLDLKKQKAVRLAGTQKLTERLGPDAERMFSFPDTEQLQVHVANPLLAIAYDLDTVLSEIGKLGWEKPKDTGGHSSNCQLNDFGIVTHYSKHGFHPYEMELGEMVRKGFMSRSDAIVKLETMPDEAALKPVAHRLGITDASYS